MRIGILGTGSLAEGLGAGWVRAGHDLVIGGRSPDKARALAARLGGSATAGTPRDAVMNRDVVLLAVLWDGVEEILDATGAADGTLEDVTVIDPVNAVEHGVGVLLAPPHGSAAERVATLAPGAHVVKAFHMFPAQQWANPESSGTDVPTVAICGDADEALRHVSDLVRDVGGNPVVLGSLNRARQLEEAAGFVMGIAFSGADPRSAIPHVPAAS